MRVYISGASSDLDMIEVYRDRLHLAGLEVLDDWMHAVRRAQATERSDRELTDAEKRRYACDDLWDVAKSDVLWLVVPSSVSIGAWIEIGYGLGIPEHVHARRIVVSGDLDRTIFLHVPRLERYKTHDEALASIVGGAIGTLTEEGVSS